MKYNKRNISKTFIIDEIDFDDEVIEISEIENLSDLSIVDGCKIYNIDSNVDLTDNPIVVGCEGVIIIGSDKNICSLFSNNDNYTMFINDTTNDCAGKVILKNITLSVYGENSSIFNLDNKENTDNSNNFIELIDVNFIANNDIGILKGYRQGLWNSGAGISNKNGLMLDGNWSGGFRNNLNRVINSSGEPFFIAGPTLKFGGRFYSNTYYTSISNSPFCDFSDVNIINDGDFQIINGDFEGSDYTIESYFPNFNIISTKGFFSSFGIPKTNVGCELIFNDDTNITFITNNEYVNVTGQTTLNYSIWFSNMNNNIVYDSDIKSNISISSYIEIDGVVNDNIAITINHWSDSENKYIQLQELIQQIPFIGRITFNSKHNIEINKNDRIELIVKNIDNNSFVTLLSNSKINVIER